MSEETLIRRSAKLSAARKGKLLYNNGTEQHFFKPDEVPEGYIPGKLKKKPLDDPEDI